MCGMGETRSEAGAAGGGGLVYLRKTGRDDEKTYRMPPRARHKLRTLGRRGGAVALVLPGGVRVKRASVGPDCVREAIGGGRGQVTGFSKASHRRMVQRLMGVDWSECAVTFVTLTYHHQYGSDFERWKAHMAAWRRRLERAYGDILRGAIWRLELQPRKSGAQVGDVAPHFHIVLFWDAMPNLQRLRHFVGASWHEIAEPSSADHAKAGTQVCPARNTSGPQMGRLLSYLAKYMGKIECVRLVDTTTGEVLPIGRVWGAWWQPPTRIVGIATMTEQSYGQFIERVNARGSASGSWYLSAISDLWSGFSVMGDGDGLLDELFGGLEVAWEPGADALLTVRGHSG